MIGCCSGSTDNTHFLDTRSCLRKRRELAAGGGSAYTEGWLIVEHLGSRPYDPDAPGP